MKRTIKNILIKSYDFIYHYALIISNRKGLFSVFGISSILLFVGKVGFNFFYSEYFIYFIACFLSGLCTYYFLNNYKNDSNNKFISFIRDFVVVFIIIIFITVFIFILLI